MTHTLATNYVKNYCNRTPIVSDVTKALDAETEAETEAVAPETETEDEAVYLETEAEARGSCVRNLRNPEKFSENSNL